jgi:hypothetical protein
MPPRPGPTPTVGRAPESLSAAGSGTRASVRVTSNEMLLSVVPTILGFHPEASAVILGTKPPSGTVGVTVRYSLDDPAFPGLAARAVADTLELLAGQGYGHAVAVGYGPDELIAPFMKLLQERAADNGIQLTRLLRAQDGRYWDCLCTDPACCPPEGTAYDLDPDLMAAARLVPGVPRVLPSREALAALVAPAGGPAAHAMRRATRRAEERADELFKQAPASADAVTRRYPVALAGIEVARKIITSYRQGKPVVSYRDAARLLVSLRDQWVRDDAWSRMEPGHREAHLRLWLDLTRLARHGYAAAPAWLLAFVAWQSGNGALANVALDRALADDPAYPMARLLSQAIHSGTPHEAANPPYTPEQIAEAYGEHGSDRD